MASSIQVRVANEFAPSPSIYQYLRSCFVRSSGIPNSVKDDWDKIGLLIDEWVTLSSHINDEEQRLSKRLELAKQTVTHLADFRVKYADYLTSEDIEGLDRYSKLARSGLDDAQVKQKLYKAQYCRNQSKQLTMLRDAVKLYSQSLPIQLEAQIDLLRKNKMTQVEYDLHIDHLKNLLGQILQLSDSAVTSLADPTRRIPKDLEKRDEIHRIIKSMLWDMHQISQLPPLPQPESKIGFTGIFVDDPDADEVIAAIAAYRQELDAEEPERDHGMS